MEIKFHVVHNQKDGVVLLEVPLFRHGHNDVKEFCSEIVVSHLTQLPHDLHLSQDHFRWKSTVKNAFDLFYGEDFSRSDVHSFYDSAITTLAKNALEVDVEVFCDIVPIVALMLRCVF
jgi:hypothetical protein